MRTPNRTSGRFWRQFAICRARCEINDKIRRLTDDKIVRNADRILGLLDEISEEVMIEDIHSGADRAHERIKRWPEWKRGLSKATKEVTDK